MTTCIYHEGPKDGFTEEEESPSLYRDFYCPELTRLTLMFPSPEPRHRYKYWKVEEGVRHYRWLEERRGPGD